LMRLFSIKRGELGLKSRWGDFRERIQGDRLSGSIGKS
jgi:hypothetical protein